ncbi:hypothetical protein [Flavobacterium beibuense]|uniref:Lipoprotein n=1 Tax=Flavobacterium beibuense TaxID=657326 RepID=A0A444W8Y7_9FLAO|nr:hypothetical protein [Flavobacterium beibuense]RYJ42340.1 hypothetical protein NU09_2126 [Flavobacterium beibuense]
MMRKVFCILVFLAIGCKSSFNKEKEKSFFAHDISSIVDLDATEAYPVIKKKRKFMDILKHYNPSEHTFVVSLKHGDRYRTDHLADRSELLKEEIFKEGVDTTGFKIKAFFDIDLMLKEPRLEKSRIMIVDNKTYSRLLEERGKPVLGEY